MAKATTIRFSDEVYARLDQASARTGMPVNSIVIAACLEWMDRHSPAREGASPIVSTPAPRWSTIRRAVELAASRRPTPGMYPFESFSENAQKLLTRSQKEAEHSGYSYIGTEHLLLAALGDPESQATKVLTALGLTDEAVRGALQKVLARGERGKRLAIVPTSRVKMVIELAFKLCQRAGDPRVSTGHILLALTTEGKGIAAHVMKDLGADREAVEAALTDTEPEA